ncbi:hypothetical protein KRE40_03685 [Elizabethkingia meningoseptica]|uniref:hypothetical protein n=1 Tax=Elizabethkingia meningoseptica TaxID=238 RepID=UPI0023AE8DB6|nr:hypothetical protein [Elizabethkingia meningoseptica]MDE5507752.1 hypothetical protein [Elizabethkingia meningoseptica]
MENTLENKAKFFAQYWGLNLYNNYKGDIYMPYPSTMEEVLRDILVTNINEYINHSYLELKSLEDITDDDALHIAKSMYTAIPDYQTISNGKCMVSCHENQIGLELLQSDYLRSKCYALPWMGLSIEKLVEYGWVKLRNKES